MWGEGSRVEGEVGSCRQTTAPGTSWGTQISLETQPSVAGGRRKQASDLPNPSLWRLVLATGNMENILQKR